MCWSINQQAYILVTQAKMSNSTDSKKKKMSEMWETEVYKASEDIFPPICQLWASTQACQS